MADRKVSAAIRTATRDDLEAIARMARHFIEASTVFRAWLKPDPAPILAVAEAILEGKTAERLNVEGGVILVLEVERELVGMIAGLVFRDPFIGDEPVFDEIVWWIEPEYRRGLAGVRLLKACELWARQKGLSLLKMVAPADAPEVGEFYLRSGFHPINTAYYKRLEE